MLNFLVSINSSFRSAIATLMIWVGILVAIVAIAPSLTEVTTNDQQEFLPIGVESVAAIELEQEKYPTGIGIPAIVVFHSEDGLGDFELEKVQSFVQSLLDCTACSNDLFIQVLSIFNAPFLKSSLLSTDNTTTTVIVTISGEPTSDGFQKSVDSLVKKASEYGGEVNIETGVTGPASILTDAIRVFQSIDLQVTLVTVLLVLVILFLIYRSPGLVLAPLLLIGSALLMAQSLAALIVDNFGLPINGQVTSIMSVLLFGAGTDYALFIISRYREELGNYDDRFAAMRATMTKVGASIAGSAGTTVVAMLLLLFSSTGSFKTMGPMLALSIGVVLAVGLTALPAALVVMGKWAFWPFSVDTNIRRATRVNVWHSVGAIVSKKPRAIFGITTAVLIICALPAFSMNPSFNFLNGFPDSAESKAGYQLLKKGFPAGELAPTSIYILRESGLKEDDWNAVNSVVSSAREITGVSRVTTPFRPDKNQDIAIIDRYNSPDGTTTRVEVVFEGDPYGAASLNQIASLRESIRTSLDQLGTDDQLKVLVGGDTAVQYDNRSAIDRDMLTLAPVILLAILVVLIILLRSVIAPLYLLFSIIISYAATYGLSVFVFQSILGHDGVAYSNAVWIFVFLVALGADYNIFVISRIREEVKLNGYREGIAAAIGRTGGVVTSAGIILAGTFSVLTTLPLRDIFQLGFAVMLGVLIDTFIVRALLVPSMVAIFKNKSWWPAKHKLSIQE